MTKEKIIFLSAKNTRTTKDWSGIPYYMYLILSEIYQVEHIKGPGFNFVYRIGFYISRIFQFLFGRKYIFDYGILISRMYGRYYSKKIREIRDCRFIFVPAGLPEIAFLKAEFPVVSVGDCSVLQLIDYYPALTSVSRLSRKELSHVEKRALANASLVVFSSSWAADFVRKQYQVTTYSIPFGGNISSGSIGAKKLNPSICRLLFIGVDWERKGGSTVIKIFEELRSRNIECRVTILGSGLAAPVAEGIDIVPYFNKDSAEGQQIFRNAFLKADFFVLPTLADCTPIVIGEAFAMGLPVLASDTGGIPSMINEGVTGFLFPVNDHSGYVNTILELLENPERYTELSENCISAYHQEFNWKAWGSRLQQLIEAKIG